MGNCTGIDLYRIRKFELAPIAVSTMQDTADSIDLSISSYDKITVDGGLVDDPFLPEEPLELLKKGKWNKVDYKYSKYLYSNIYYNC